MNPFRAQQIIIYVLRPYTQVKQSILFEILKNYFVQKNYDDSIKCFERVIQLSPDYPYAYYSLGMAYEQKRDVAKALEYYYLYSGIEKDENMLKAVKQKIKSLEG